jgi:hypothetical protein
MKQKLALLILAVVCLSANASGSQEPLHFTIRDGNVLQLREVKPYIAVTDGETTYCEYPGSALACLNPDLEIHLNGIFVETESRCGGSDQGCSDYWCCIDDCTQWVGDRVWPVLRTIAQKGAGGIIEDACGSRWDVTEPPPTSCGSDCNPFDCMECCGPMYDDGCEPTSCASPCTAIDCDLTCCDFDECFPSSNP